MHDEKDWLATRFEENRGYLHTVAHRLLGSGYEAEDAVQETWIRLSRSDPSDIAKLSRHSWPPPATVISANCWRCSIQMS